MGCSRASGGVIDGHYQLLVAIIQELDAGGVCDGLITAGFPGPTRVNSVGGFLEQGNVTLLVGVEAVRLTEALRTIAAHCQTRSQYVHPLPPIVDPAIAGITYPLEVHVGGATIFILDLDRYERW
ncbi:MAG TPA: cyclic-di-AMP receptor [Chloroflexota bacterium]|jgi:uncharacterized protein YaaQ